MEGVSPRWVAAGRNGNDKNDDNHSDSNDYESPLEPSDFKFHHDGYCYDHNGNMDFDFYFEFVFDLAD